MLPGIAFERPRLGTRRCNGARQTAPVVIPCRDQRRHFVILFARPRAAEPIQRLDTPIAQQELI
jgi:hypothetical protein